MREGKRLVEVEVVNDVLVGVGQQKQQLRQDRTTDGLTR